jgi:hypothetical protein
MTDKPITVRSGEMRPSATTDPDTGLTPQKELAAEMLAEGKRRREVQEAIGCDLVTLWRWCQEEAFIAYAVEVRKSLRSSRQAEREALIRDALIVDRAVIAGTIDADSPRARRAAEVLRDTEYRVYERDDAGIADIIRRGFRDPNDR